MFKATLVDNFVANAMKFKGQNYKYGAGHAKKLSKPGPVDCSGLVSQAGWYTGIKTVGTASSQQKMGKSVSMKNLKPGDLVFSGNPAYHVGIYVGDGKVLHAPSAGKKVSYIDLSYFKSARRIFQGLTDKGSQLLKSVGATFKKLDTDKNNVLSAAELKQKGGSSFKTYDTNKNGSVTLTETKNKITAQNTY